MMDSWMPSDLKKIWYSKSLEYWEEQPTTINGVLGGFSEVHPIDSITSMAMIEKFKDRISGFQNAIDCGAGIGRISKETLLNRFKNVDLLEPVDKQI